MHKKLTGLLSLSMLTVMSASAFADDGKWSVGASVLYQEQAYRGTKTSDKFMPVPMVNYEGKNFYFHTLATGYYLWNDKKDQLSVDLFYYPQAYRAKDNKDSRMRKLDNRRDTAMAGLSYRHHEEWGTLRTNFSGDILGKSDGMRFDAAYLYGFEGDKWSVQPGVGVIWSSENRTVMNTGSLLLNPAAAVWMNTVRAAAGHRMLRCPVIISLMKTGLHSRWAVSTCYQVRPKTARWWIKNTPLSCGLV